VGEGCWTNFKPNFATGVVPSKRSHKSGVPQIAIHLIVQEGKFIITSHVR
jgi:hypothetical protein